MSELQKKLPERPVHSPIKPMSDDDLSVESSVRSTPSSHYTSVRGFIIHSPLTAGIAQRLQRRCVDDFASAYPMIEYDFQCIAMPASFDQAHTMLTRERFLENEWNAGSDCFQFIITVGAWETHAVAHARGVAFEPIPHFYCLDAPFSPITNDVSYFGGHYGVHATPTSPSEYLSGVLGIKPDVKKIALLFDNHSLSDQFNIFINARSKDFINECMARDIQVCQVPWSVADELSYLADRIDGCDAVIVLEGPTIEAHRAALVELCNARKIVLCTTELDSVFLGAALGCGLTTASYAAPIVSLMSDALLYNSLERCQPFVIKQQEGLRFNRDALRAQGVQLTEQQEALLKMRSIYSITIVEL